MTPSATRPPSASPSFFLQITILLSSVAALMKRRTLWYAALVLGTIAWCSSPTDFCSFSRTDGGRKMPATVWFADMRSSTKQNILAKIDLLLSKTGLEEKVGRKQLVALKIHFGELGNTAYVRPVYVRRIVESLRRLGARPFLIDTNTLYVGSRGDSASHYETAIANGFDWSAIGAPVVIGGGLRGNRFAR